MTDFITYTVEEAAEDLLKNHGIKVEFSRYDCKCMQLFSEYHPKRLLDDITVSELNSVIKEYLSLCSIPLGIEDPDLNFDFSLYLSLDTKTWIKKLDSNDKDEIGKAGFQQTEYPHMLIIHNREKEKQYFQRPIH